MELDCGPIHYQNVVSPGFTSLLKITQNPKFCGLFYDMLVCFGLLSCRTIYDIANVSTNDIHFYSSNLF